ASSSLSHHEGRPPPGAAIERLCQELNLDAASAAEALRDFTALRGTYSLEGEALHWLACALYVACRKSVLPTVGSGLMEGNCVSLTRILRSAKLSLIQFFSKMKKWMDMSNLPQEFRERVERLERNFEVSTVIFKKFEPIFLDVFQNPFEETSKPQRSRKQRYFSCDFSRGLQMLRPLFMLLKNMVNRALRLALVYAVLCEFRTWPLVSTALHGGRGRVKHQLEIQSDRHNHVFETLLLTDFIAYFSVSQKRSFAPSTPLTGRRYLREKEAVITPVASATQSVSRLQNIVAGLKNAPSEQLITIFESCARSPMESITNRVKEIGETFCRSYTQSTDEQPGSHIDFAVNRLKLAEILYYKILETIMVQETRRLHGKDMTALLEQDVFHRSLMACCLEIVLFAYSSPRTFPWIIEVLDLRPFYFYKVIEVLIRSEEGLSRDMVKHLNSIEEQILESLAWTRDSALWSALQASENRVPTCEEVIFPSNFEASNGGSGLGHLPMMPVSPIVHPRVKEVRTDLGGTLRRDLQPLSPISVHERYSSPTAGSAKRRLFGDDSPKEMQMEKILTEGTKLTIAPASSIATENISVSPGQTVLTMTTATVPGKAGQKVTIPLHGIAHEMGGITLIPISMNLGQPPKMEAQAPYHPQVSQAQEGHLSSGSKPKKTGSLALFYRKVYHLASVRLRDLCLKLDVSNDLRRKIWTCFEFTLVHCADLMKDRHLDQLLLCAFYIMAKVTKEERTFQDIMKSYRNQPQANSHVYRSVLLRNYSDDVLLDKNKNQDVEMTEAEKSSESGTEERGDLITFYNAVYVGRVQSFALKYDITNQDHVMEAPPLSPFPNIKQQPVSPRRISQQHSVYVSPHKNGACLTPRTALLYKFNGSPSKSLKDINNMIKQGEHRSKKRAITIDSDTESPTKRLCQENDDVLLKRLQDVVSERANH
uniref:RB transcriptional corepressor like 1 n=1 Tax=Anas platyrhynchos platyrhynchos TaxID=8840 RepID=A0A493T5K7_ANAPP